MVKGLYMYWEERERERERERKGGKIKMRTQWD